MSTLKEECKTNYTLNISMSDDEEPGNITPPFSNRKSQNINVSTDCPDEIMRVLQLSKSCCGIFDKKENAVEIVTNTPLDNPNRDGSYDISFGNPLTSIISKLGESEDLEDDFDSLKGIDTSENQEKYPLKKTLLDLIKSKGIKDFNMEKFKALVDKLNDIAEKDPDDVKSNTASSAATKIENMGDFDAKLTDMEKDLLDKTLGQLKSSLPTSAIGSSNTAPGLSESLNEGIIGGITPIPGIGVPKNDPRRKNQSYQDLTNPPPWKGDRTIKEEIASMLKTAGLAPLKNSTEIPEDDFEICDDEEDAKSCYVKGEPDSEKLSKATAGILAFIEEHPEVNSVNLRAGDFNVSISSTTNPNDVLGTYDSWKGGIKESLNESYGEIKYPKGPSRTMYPYGYSPHSQKGETEHRPAKQANNSGNNSLTTPDEDPTIGLSESLYNELQEKFNRFKRVR